MTDGAGYFNGIIYGFIFMAISVLINGISGHNYMANLIGNIVTIMFFAWMFMGISKIQRTFPFRESFGVLGLETSI